MDDSIKIPNVLEWKDCIKPSKHSIEQNKCFLEYSVKEMEEYLKSCSSNKND